MKLKTTPVVLHGNDGDIRILRNGHGIPDITAVTVADLMRGLGWVHANDRQLQTLLTRILLQGRAAELLKADDGLIEIDTYMRRMNFLPDPQEQIARLEPLHARPWMPMWAVSTNGCKTTEPCWSSS
jgi:penicillin amidase